MLSKDLYHGARALRKRPGFSAIVAITLALGIGASTAIFSVTNAVLLRPLPYKDPARLAVACYDMRTRNVRDFPFSNVNYLDLRKGATAAFEDITAVRTQLGVVPGADGTPEQVRVGVVSTNFFRVMGARVVIGRDFTDQDGLVQTPPPAAPGAAPVPPAIPQMVILSYEYWQRRYGGDRRVLAGWNNPEGTRIVGVLEPGFELLFPADANLEQKPDFWNAARIPYDAANRNNVLWRLIGRLHAGVTLEQAQREAERVAAEIRRTDSIANTAGSYIRIVPMKEHLVGGVESTVISLMGAVVLLVLISCANVANLLLVRMSLRERELAVRAAIGGSAWDLARQALAEVLLLAGAGVVLGIALAWTGIRQLLAIAPASLPRLNEVRIDPIVLVFAAVVGIVSAAVVGLVPAVRAARPDLIPLLSGSRNAGLNRGGRLRSGVVVAEVALSFVLLIASGLMIRSFLTLRKVQPGYDARNLLTFQLLGRQPPNEPAARAAIQRQIQTRLASISGIESVTASFPLPLTGNFSPIRWGLQDALADASRFQATDFQVVLPGYFKTMGTPILEGREFTDADNQPGRKLVIIDQHLAAKAFPGASAVGQRILLRLITPEPEWFEVIGVAAHERNTELAVVGREQTYFTDAYVGNFANRWALRTVGDPAKFAAAVREEIRKQDPSLLITELQPMQEWIERSMAGTRFSLLLIGLFAAIAALLAAVGLYAVLATVVRQRTAEIGVRMALGAAPGGILSLMIGYGLRLSGAGMAIGLLCALVTTPLMTSMLVGVKPEDPATFVAIALVFSIIAGAASWLPAHRAARLDPTVALRDE